MSFLFPGKPPFNVIVSPSQEILCLSKALYNCETPTPRSTTETHPKKDIMPVKTSSIFFDFGGGCLLFKVLFILYRFSLSNFPYVYYISNAH